MGLATSLLLAAVALLPVPLPGTSQPAWAPHGARFAYVQASGKRLHVARAEIFIGVAGRGTSRRLTRGGGYNTAPAWSPDGRRIAFVRTSYDQTRGALMLMASSGQGKRVLLNGFVSRPTWSPDSETLAYVRNRRLELLSARTGVVRDLGPAPGADPAWSPDGSLIAFAGGCTVYVVDVQTGATYPSETLGCFPETTVGSPSWIDSGTRIAFSMCELWRRCRLAYAPRLPELRDFTVTADHSYVGLDTAFSSDGFRVAWSCLSGFRSTVLIRDLRYPVGLVPDCD
jgi:Tol biopolymer transport system component